MNCVCDDALARSKLWQADAWPNLESLPSAGQMLCDRVNLPELDAVKMQALLDDAYRTRLY